jgi:hypothetical protein
MYNREMQPISNAAPDIEYVLHIDADLARREYAAADATLRRICCACNGGQPQEIEKGFRNLNLAGVALMVALKRYDDFIVNGAIPEDI